jgi:serine/threonine protein kinase
MKTRRRSRRGGKHIGEGASAFVIDPPPQCKDGRDMTPYVARLSKKRSVRDLLTKFDKPLIRSLRKIDPDQKYFLYPEHCEFGTLTEENKQDGFTESNKHYAEILKRGGDKWFDYRHPEKWRDPSEAQLTHLKKAIDLLHSHKIVHGDLNGDNIIYGEDDMPRIIDFATAVRNAPREYIEQEDTFIKRGWPTLEYYKVYESNTPEGRELNEMRKKYRSLLNTKRRRTIRK